MDPTKLQNYLDLLSIRQAAARRDVSILGGIAIVSLLGMFAFGMLDRIHDRSVYLIGGILIGFLVAALMAWVKLQIVNNAIELLENLYLALDANEK
jgi:hypothetical protein